MGREPSLLANPHRELLAGERTPRPSDERAMRSTMRQRTREGIIDFSTLFENLEPKDREMIFRGQQDASAGDDDEQQFSGERDILDGEVDPDLPRRFFSQDEDILIRTNSRLEGGMVDAVGFLYLAANDAGLDPRDLIEHGVKRAEERMNDGRWIINDVSLTVDKSVKHTLAKRALRIISEGGELTDAEVRALLESGRGNITPGEIRGYLNGEWEPPEDELLDPATGV